MVQGVAVADNEDVQPANAPGTHSWRTQMEATERLEAGPGSPIVIVLPQSVTGIYAENIKPIWPP